MTQEQRAKDSLALAVACCIDAGVTSDQIRGLVEKTLKPNKAKKPEMRELVLLLTADDSDTLLARLEDLKTEFRTTSVQEALVAAVAFAHHAEFGTADPAAVPD